MASPVGANALSLIKEARRAGHEPFPYNEAAVRATCQEVAFLLEEITQTIEAHEASAATLDEGATTKIQVLHAFIRHVKKCLVAYALHRASLAKSTCFGGVDAETQSMLTPDEVAYAERYAALVARTHYATFPSLDWSGVRVGEPPDDVFVRVMAVRDCGEIVTEHGTVVLNAGTVAFLLRSDVQHLLHGGHLKCV